MTCLDYRVENGEPYCAQNIRHLSDEKVKTECLSKYLFCLEKTRQKAKVKREFFQIVSIGEDFESKYLNTLSFLGF